MRHTRRHATGSAFLLLTAYLAYAAPAMALETDARGYIGYVGVASDEDVVCGSRSCQGVFSDTLFYGLSLSAQGEELGAQVVISQDDEEDPEFSIAQLTARTGFGGVQASARIGKIIVPLGLHGSQRITPTARPGLVQPQSFFLNTYYDLLTLSEQGLALQFNSETWNFKIAAYKPRREVIERIIELPSNEQANFLQGVLTALFGGGFDSSAEGNTVLVTERREFEGGYLGLGHQGDASRSDLGYVRLDLNGERVDALNLGHVWMLGAWEPSIELFQLKLHSTGNSVEGASLNLTYSAESWQSFGNIVHIDSVGDSSREFIVGGAYYWNENWSGLLAARQLQGDFSSVGGLDDEVNTLSLSLAYSWD